MPDSRTCDICDRPVLDRGQIIIRCDDGKDRIIDCPSRSHDALERRMVGISVEGGWPVFRVSALQDADPERDAEINAAFGLLQPQGQLGRVERCYRAHCREILDAIGEGREPPTVSWAECCLAFCVACCRAPFIAEAAVAYGLAFRRAFPDDPQALEIQVPDSTDALYMLPEAEELLTGLRRHIEQRKAAQA